MPDYWFKCEKCTPKINMFCKISEYDERLKDLRCPSCNSNNLSAIIDGPSMICVPTATSDFKQKKC